MYIEAYGVFLSLQQSFKIKIQKKVSTRYNLEYMHSLVGEDQNYESLRWKIAREETLKNSK